MLQIFISVSSNFDCIVLFLQNFTNLKNLRFCLEILFPDYRLDFQAVKKTACYFPFDIINASLQTNWYQFDLATRCNFCHVIYFCQVWTKCENTVQNNQNRNHKINSWRYCIKMDKRVIFSKHFIDWTVVLETHVTFRLCKFQQPNKSKWYFNK